MKRLRDTTLSRRVDLGQVTAVAELLRGLSSRGHKGSFFGCHFQPDALAVPVVLRGSLPSQSPSDV